MGRPEAHKRPDILLSGEAILDLHCEFINEDGCVTLAIQPKASVYINGKQVNEPTVIHTGSRVILGEHHVFRYNDPQEARQSRHNLSSIMGIEIENKHVIRVNVPEQPLDWKYAQQELLEKQGIDLKADMEKKLLEMESQYRKEKVELEKKMYLQTKVTGDSFAYRLECCRSTRR